MPDFFLNEEDIAGLDASAGKAVADNQGIPDYAGAGGAAAGANPVSDIFNKVAASITPELVESTKAIYLFELSGDHAGQWHADLKNGSGSVGQGPPSIEPDVTFRMKSKDFVAMFSGKLATTSAFMTGKLKISGNMGLAMKLEKLMKGMRSKL